VAYAIQTALSARGVDIVAVSTEDEEIASVSRILGAEIIKRPDELAEDEVSLPEVIKHAKLYFEDQEIVPKRFISLQPTGPFITSQSLTKAIALHERTNCNSVVSIAEITQSHPYWAKSYDPETGKVNSFLDVDVQRYPQKQDLPRCYMYTGGFYIRKTELLNEPDGFYLGSDIRGYLLMDEEVLDIDTEDDMRYFEFLVAKMNKAAQKAV
jgi:CMP-N-acetylneuraminic acid synthetase